jgi:hypothetical protein
MGTRVGVVYTPRDVCEPMVRLALAPLRERDVLSLRVCDPAIGEGAFLVEIVRVLAERLGGPDARLRVAEQCIYGVDIDARAVAIARAAVEELVGAPVPALAEHLRVADALECDWPLTFDAVIANPPYIRQELIANKSRLRSFDVYDGVADLYVYFVELAHRIGRRFCIVMPNKWMTAAYGRPLRSYLAARGSVEGVIDFEEGLFSDADAFPCIMWGTSTGATKPLRAGRARPPIAAALEGGLVHERTRWQSEPWHIDSPDDAPVLDRIMRTCRPLGELVGQPSRGVVTGCNRAFVITREQRDALGETELVRPFVKGRDIRRWRAADIERYIVLVDRGTELTPPIREHLLAFRDALEPKPPNHEGEWTGRKPGSYKWYELQDPVVPLAKSREPRIFYQDIQSAPAACLDLSGELVPDTTVWILPTADRFILALLNSSFYAWYARRRFPPALNGAVRPKLEYMRGLPVAEPRPALREQITKLVDAQLAGASHDAEIDRLIDEAYGLDR